MSDKEDSVRRFNEIGKKISELTKNAPKIEISQIPKVPSFTVPAIENYTQLIDFEELSRERHEEYEREEKYKQDVLTTLKSIEKNTGGIAEIVDLIRENNGKQDQIVKLLTEILSVGGSKNKEEAETKFKSAMKKIQDFGGTVESIQTLYGVLMTVYNTATKLM